MTTINLKVEGMSCSHCENAVKKAVSALDGVDSVSVNLKKKTVEVVYDDGKSAQESIARAIADQGYKVAKTLSVKSNSK
ncbi:MAG: copper ion binding protein [Clostridiales bacterium]|jgi:copper chaperone|nr:copper ion binding protein [Clostridiales bacterium]